MAPRGSGSRLGTARGNAPPILRRSWESASEFEQIRAATIAAVEAAETGRFARHIRSAGGVPGPLAVVFHQVAVMHVGHARDIAGTGRG
jgi:hypothetical protein